MLTSEQSDKMSRTRMVVTPRRINVNMFRCFNLFVGLSISKLDQPFIQMGLNYFLTISLTHLGMCSMHRIHFNRAISFKIRTFVHIQRWSIQFCVRNNSNRNWNVRNLNHVFRLIKQSSQLSTTISNLRGNGKLYHFKIKLYHWDLGVFDSTYKRKWLIKT